MKYRRFIAAVICGLLVLSFCSCNSSLPAKGKTTLCGWFDSLGFKEGLTQKEYVAFLDRMSYDGKTLTKLAPYAFFEYTYGNGCSGSCNKFSYGREEAQADGMTIVSYLIFSSMPDGISFPHNINFGDSAASVLTAFGYGDAVDFFHLQTQFRTLSEQEGEVLILRNLSVNSTETGYMYPYQLIYTETYKDEIQGGKVERSIEFYFSEGQNPVLTTVRLYLSETF